MRGSMIPAPVLEGVLSAALAAHKAGTLDELLRRRPRLMRWFARHHLRPVTGTAGDALKDRHNVDAVSLWLVWAVTQLRPDHEPRLDGIDAAAWLERTSWRPMLAVMCHFGFAPVPDFRSRYHRREDESPADNLCGLWAVGPSTFYRYLDKGKRLIAQGLAEGSLGDRDRLSLRQLVQREADARLGLTGVESQAWHRRQAETALETRDAHAALWHFLHARDPAAFIDILLRYRIELAADVQTDPLIEMLSREALGPRGRFDLCLAQAGLWRIREAPERERQAFEHALRVAVAVDDKLMLGIVYGAMGRFHETRDPDRAFACYEDSVEFLRRAGLQDDMQADPGVVQEYVLTLIKLAWLYVLRNDPRCKAALERADLLRNEPLLSQDAIAMLEQVWGEYWRRAGEHRRALEHKQRALNIYERLDDRQQVLKTYGNLILIYTDLQDFDRAIEYSRRILDMAVQIPVEPETLASTHINLGATYFWQGRYDMAIEQYRLGLAQARQASLQLHMRRAHYNLAEAYYKRFQATAVADDEQLGDAHAAAALKAWPAESDPSHFEATRNLKTEILGPRDGKVYDRLLPEEFAAHFDEMAEVQRQRALLAVPVAADVHVRAHLVIAQAYLAIASKEREAALALIHKHGLGDQFATEFDQLRSTFNRELTREQQLASQWAQAAGELLQEQRRIAVLDHLFRAGSIQKSMYAQVCGVGLATASKHLATLAERGLLEQTGKGPSTRYVLPH